jgi:hypothetical protein
MDLFYFGMNPDEKYKIYRAGYNEGIIHQEPSKETKIFMEKTGNDITQMKLDIQQLKDNTKGIAEDLGELKLDVKDFIKCADNKYAGKWVEDEMKKHEDNASNRSYDWLKWLVMFGVATLVSVLINHIFK